MDCDKCGADNLTDGPLCPSCTAAATVCGECDGDGTVINIDVLSDGLALIVRVPCPLCQDKPVAIENAAAWCEPCFSSQCEHALAAVLLTGEKGESCSPAVAGRE